MIWNDTINCKYFATFFELYPKKPLDNTVKANNAKIITLPEEKALPCYMMCWDTDELEAEKRLVIYYNKQLVCPFISLCETSEERYLKGETNCFFKVFKHAKEIEEPENKMDAAIEEICKELDNIVNQLNSLKNSPNE